MREIVIQSLLNVLDKKRADNVGPSEIVLLNELLLDVGTQVKEILRQLRNEKKIFIGHTVNDRYMKIISEDFEIPVSPLDEKQDESPG